MTIAAAYIVSDGVIFGADSTATISIPYSTATCPDKKYVMQVHNHAQKIYEVGVPGQSRLALCTSGANTVGNQNHRIIAARLSDRVTSNSTVAEAKNHLISVIEEELPTDQQPDFSYLFGGTDPVTHAPVLFSISCKGGKLTCSEPHEIGRFTTSGIGDAFLRVWQGYDQNLPDLLLKELTLRLGNSLPDDFQSKFPGIFSSAVTSLRVPGSSDIPLRDAIDKVYACIYITVKTFKFRCGVPTVGGPIELGFISTDRPFRWIKHKPFESSIED